MLAASPTQSSEYVSSITDTKAETLLDPSTLFTVNTANPGDTGDNTPLEGAKVLVKGYKNQIIGDTIITNKEGEFMLNKSAFPAETINTVVFEPNNQVPTDSVQHKVQYEKNQQIERSFYRGECKIETKIKVK